MPWFGCASLLLAAGLAGCGADPGARPGERAAPGEHAALRGRPLTDTLALGLPMAVLAMGGKLVVQDMATDAAVQVFDAEGHRIASTGREGSGPGEFTDPLDAFSRPGHPGEFWVFDSRTSRLTPYELDAFAQGRTPRPSGDAVTLSPPFVFETPRWLDDSTLVALDPMTTPGEGRFALFAPDGARHRSVGAPPPGPERIPPLVRQQAYGGYIAVHPQRPLFVLASRYAGRLEVYGRDGGLIGRMQVPEAFEPDFSAARDGVNMVRGPGFRFGYVDVAVTADRVLGLYSGRRFEAGPDDRAHLGDQVHFFDWQGRFLGAVRLDAGAMRIAVDAAGDRLYALLHDPHPQVIEYPLGEAGPAKLARR
ncbi:MAG: BF3164 family lipoprotein [Gemmatimonadota bacterium]